MNKRPTLDELEIFFDNHFKGKPYIQPIKLNDCSTITNPIKFYKSHIAFLRCHKGEKLYLSYYERVESLYHILNEESQKSDTQK